MSESRGDEQCASGSGPFTAAIECGPYQREAEVAGLGEREVTLGVFLAFAALVDSPGTDPDQLAEFLSATIQQTGQVWIYPADVFLRNLLQRGGDQSKVRRALACLAVQDPDEEPGSS